MNRAGLVFGLAAYGWWGLMPLYFRELEHVPSEEMLAHRIVWSVVLLGLILTATKRWSSVAVCLRRPRNRVLLLITSLLLACNWLAYLYAVSNHRIIQASLGYYILPLVSILIGRLGLGEPLSRPQWVAVTLGAAGVALLVSMGDEPPTLALVIALSFGIYGLLRKKIEVDGLAGLGIETLMLLPVAAGYLILLGWRGRGILGTEGVRTDVLLLSSSVVTTVPLLCFGEAARRLPLTTLGFMQYLSPTVQLLLAVHWFGTEEFDAVKWISFSLIWAGLGVYTVSALRNRASG